ncbi:MAG: hypothetical protein AAB263_20515 [Planctomycetota bacterium]
MTSYRILCIVFLLECGFLYGEDGKSIDVKTGFERLVLQLPKQSDLADAAKIVTGNKNDSMDTKTASEKVALAKKIIPALREQLKTGKSVFDYPGLISRGQITYHSSGKYEIYFGVYLLGDQGQDKYDFKLVISERGLIDEINDVIWKK